MLITRGELGQIVREEAARLQEAPRKGAHPRWKAGAGIPPAAGRQVSSAIAKHTAAQKKAQDKRFQTALAELADAAMDDVDYLSSGEQAAATDELEKELRKTIERFKAQLQSVEDEGNAYGKHMDREFGRQSARHR